MAQRRRRSALADAQDLGGPVARRRSRTIAIADAAAEQWRVLLGDVGWRVTRVGEGVIEAQPVARQTTRRRRAIAVSARAANAIVWPLDGRLSSKVYAQLLWLPAGRDDAGQSATIEVDATNA